MRKLLFIEKEISSCEECPYFCNAGHNGHYAYSEKCNNPESEYYNNPIGAISFLGRSLRSIPPQCPLKDV